MAPAVAFAIQALTALPGLIEAGINVAHTIETTVSSLKSMQAEGRDPTQAEWDALNAATDAALARLDVASQDPA